MRYQFVSNKYNHSSRKLKIKKKKEMTVQFNINPDSKPSLIESTPNSIVGCFVFVILVNQKPKLTVVLIKLF